jgi:hypothetical protein
MPHVSNSRIVEENMKTSKWMMLVGVAVALGLMVSPARAQSVNLSADIPFAFSVKDVAMTAGRCTLYSEADQWVQLRDSEGHNVITILNIDDIRDAQEAKMIFHRYGNQYFLVRIETLSAVYELPISRRERKLAGGTAPLQVAILARTSGVAGL